MTEANHLGQDIFANIIDMTMDAVITVDEDQRILLFNHGAERIFGYRAEDVLGQPLDLLLPPRLAEAHRQHVRAFAAAPQSAASARLMGERRQVFGRRKSGSEFPAEVSISKLTQNGQTIFTAVLRDITERKRAEEQLHLQSVALQAAANGIVITDREGTIRWVNPAFIRMTGYTAEEVLGQNPRILKSGKQDASFYRQLWDTILSGRVWSGETINKRKDGSLYTEEQMIAPVRDELGEISNFIAIKQDITERKQTEAALRESEARARELAVAAEAANRAKSEFLANMSHEIRTPLNGVLGLLELVLSTGLTPEQHGYLEKVRSSADMLLILLNDVLDLSKIEAGQLELEQVDFDLNVVIHQAMTTLSLRAADKGLNLVTVLDPDVPAGLSGDPTRVRQVLLNLLSNAIKFTERGEVRLTVRRCALALNEVNGTEQQVADGVMLHFAVSDTGIGIPRDRQAFIFEPFTQLDGSITRRYGGTGLGLSISLNLVEKFGGQLWLESEPGQGSTFHFTARFGLAQTAGEQGSRGAGERNLPSPNLGRGDEGEGLSPLLPRPPAPLHILLAEDNPINQDVTVEMLKRRGWTVDVAEDGEEAVARAAETDFDLILMDVQMPKLDGLRATSAIRAHERMTGKHVPIAALTAHAMQGDRELCLAAGMDGYLPKPITMGNLYTLVEQLVGGKMRPPGRGGNSRGAGEQGSDAIEDISPAPHDLSPIDPLCRCL